jgi:hypothetical protein
MAVSGAELSERLWEQAFQLSYFVLMDRARARECVARALEKLAAQRSREKRRVYWRSRKKQLTIRRISRPTDDALQWLICLEAEVCEKEQELEGLPTEADMVVRYVKHLAQMTTVNSSFHVNVGFNRLLRNYTTPEVQQIYELATERYPAAEEYRKAKGKLLNQLTERFGRFLRVRTARYGELQFETHPTSERWVALIEECLQQFAPWSGRLSCFEENSHARPAAAGGHAGYPGSSSRPPDRLETSRCHWFMHSTCYGWLVEQLGFSPPGERLSVPRFLHHDGGDPGSNHDSAQRRTVPLSNDETRRLRERMVAVAAPRQDLIPWPLKIIAQGTLCAKLVMAKGEPCRFEIAEGIRLLEVWTDAGEQSRIVATHWMDFDADGLYESGEYAIDLPDGRDLALSITPTPSAAAQGSGGAIATIESRSTSSLLQWLQRLSPVWRPEVSPLRPVLTSVALVALGAIAGGAYFQSRIPPDREPAGGTEASLTTRQNGATVQQNGTIAPARAPEAQSPQSVTRYAFNADTTNLREAGRRGEPVVSLPTDEALAILELPVHAGEHAVYRVTLSSFPEQQERLSEPTLRPRRHGDRWIVELALPTALVESGSHYLVTVTSMSGTDSARYLFEVQKKVR